MPGWGLVEEGVLFLASFGAELEIVPVALGLWSADGRVSDGPGVDGARGAVFGSGSADDALEVDDGLLEHFGLGGKLFGSPWSCLMKVSGFSMTDCDGKFIRQRTATRIEIYLLVSSTIYLVFGYQTEIGTRQ